MYMRIKDVMTRQVISVRTEDSAETAARLLSRSNVGALPVCDDGGRVVGIVTDRDIVTRCVAAGLLPKKTSVGSVMTGGVVTAEENEEAGDVSVRMGMMQVRRVPVTGGGVLRGIVSLGDLARAGEPRTAETLTEISGNISRR